MTTKPPTEANQTNAATPQAPKRRTRGPNKPKPAALVDVETSARMSQAAIIKVITEYVANMLDGDTAASMELQIQDGTGEWRPIIDDPSIRIRFVTKGSE